VDFKLYTFSEIAEDTNENSKNNTLFLFDNSLHIPGLLTGNLRYLTAPWLFLLTQALVSHTIFTLRILRMNWLIYGNWHLMPKTRISQKEHRDTHQSVLNPGIFPGTLCTGFRWHIIKSTGLIQITCCLVADRDYTLVL